MTDTAERLETICRDLDINYLCDSGNCKWEEHADELRDIIDDIRTQLSTCESAGDFCLKVGEMLGMDKKR